MKRILAALAVTLLAAAPSFGANAQKLKGSGTLTNEGYPGYGYDLTSDTAEGVYLIGPALTSARVDFVRGSAFVGTLYVCNVQNADADGDGSVDATAGCDSGISLNATTSTTKPTGKRYYILDINTAESGSNVSQLTIRGTNSETASGGGGSGFDSCRDGNTPGGGLDEATGRYAWTCGNYNWHGWRDSTQATASYDVTCTGDGTPHTSCLRSGEIRHIGYPLHRIALAAQYTDDGGRVYLPKGIYVDDGAGTLSDGTTRAKMPKPYDPEWEARTNFAALDYPTMLAAVVLDRGVRLIGEGVPQAITHDPSDSTVTEDTPKITGTWVVDDRGTADADPGAGNTLDGENEDIEPPNQYRGIVIGGNRFTPYCSTTADDDPTCDRNQNLDALKMPGEMYEWGVEFETLANFDAETGNLCVPDADEFASSPGNSPDTGAGTCSGNRMIRCWDTSGSADVARSSGGCDFGDVSFGTCESPFDALSTDYTTNGIDLQLALHFSQCTDDASSATDCDLTNYTGHNIVIADIRAAPGASITGSSCDSGNGTNVQIGIAAPTAADYTTPMPFRNFYVGSNTQNRIIPIRRGAMNGRGAGFENIGRMPANWWGRNSETAAADCLSGGDIDNADDETACDTDTLAAFSHSHNNYIGPNNLFFNVSQALGNKSGVVETFPSGGPNDFVGNRVLNQYRGVLSDWGEGSFSNNFVDGFGMGGTQTAMMACFADHCRFEDNTFQNIYTSGVYQFVTAAAHSVIARNTYRNVRAGGPAYLIQGPKSVTIEDEIFEEFYGWPVAYIQPGVNHKQKPTVKISGLRGFIRPTGVASNATTGGGVPTTAILVEGDDSADSLTDEYKSLVVDDVHLSSGVTDTCLIWFEDDVRGGAGGSADSASLNRESAVRATIMNSSITSSGSPAIACTGQYEYTAAISDATDSDTWAFEAYAPSLIGNLVNNEPVPDMMRTVSVGEVPDADDLPDGTVVRVYDGHATACSHTNGALTSGSTLSTCISDPGTSGSATDGTWTAY